MSLRLRLTLFFSLFIAVILAVVSLSTFSLTERFLDQTLKERARESMERIDGALFYEVSSLLAADIIWDFQILGFEGVPLVNPNDLQLFEPNAPPGDVELRSLLTDQNRQELVESGE